MVVHKARSECPIYCCRVCSAPWRRLAFLGYTLLPVLASECLYYVVDVRHYLSLTDGDGGGPYCFLAEASVARIQPVANLYYKRGPGVLCLLEREGTR